MRLPHSAHTSRPWLIHELTTDFRLEDVWALRTPGTRDEFSRLVELVASFDPAHSPSRAVRSLFALRWWLGEVFGLDVTAAAPDGTTPTLRDRVPAQLRDTATGAPQGTLPFNTVYLTDGEWALELANRTVHGVLHLGWVPDDGGGYRGQLAIYAKRNGLLGTAYMALIKPFRYVFVYPALLGQLEQQWRVTAPSAT